MTIAIGETLPAANFVEMGENGPVEVSTERLFKGRKVVLFAVPGAYTGVCSTQHVPSFVRTSDAIRGRGVDEIVCVAVNDPFVLKAWSASTGAGGAGIRMLSDAGAVFTKAIGMDYSFPAHGMINRSRRYAMMVDDGVVKVLNVEAGHGVCELTAGETLLAAL